jgi:GNAT superfamily N-acetyltransferase
MAEIRPYQNDDLAQLTALANAHIAVATPGFTVSTQWIAARLERNPDEYVTDPWVAERATLVAVERERVAAAAQLHRYAADERVSQSLSGTGELAWLYARPEQPEAGEALVEACVARLRAWEVRRVLALGGGLGPLTYGVPDTWPHIAALLSGAGFDDGCVQEEVLYAAAVDELAPAPALHGVQLGRAAFDHGLELRALRGSETLGRIRIEVSDPEELPGLARWGEVWGIDVTEPERRRGVGSWLVARAADWLRLAGRDRLTAEVLATEDATAGAFWRAVGLREVTRIRRGFQLA